MAPPRKEAGRSEERFSAPSGGPDEYAIHLPREFGDFRTDVFVIKPLLYVL